MRRTFIELPSVSRVFSDQRLPDEAVRQMQREIMQHKGDTIPGTGGLKKIRCAVAGQGKSGGVRVIFADYPQFGLTLLVAAFAKNVKGNLSPAERNALAQLKSALDRTVARRDK